MPLLCNLSLVEVRQARVSIYADIQNLPSEYYLIFKSFLSERHFQIKHGEAYSTINQINSAVPQGSVFGPLLYLLYTADIPITPTAHTGTFADDTVIMSRHYDTQIAAVRVQKHLNLIHTWLKDWRIKVYETRSTQVIYTLRRSDSPHVYLNNIEIIRANVAKYLGLHLDSKLTWEVHIAKKEGDGYKN